MQRSFTTRSLNVPFPTADPHRSLDMPVYETVAYDFDNSEEMGVCFRGEKHRHVYSRTSNPTVEYLEEKMKVLTGAHHALAVSSGMAAITNSILALCKTGDNLIASSHLFGHSFALLDQSLRNYGLEPRFVDHFTPESLEALIDDRTRLIFFETVTNPQLEIEDIRMIAEIAHRRKVLVMVDSTVTPPVVFNSARLGVDIEVMSSTKFISGGGTSFGGIILDNGTFDWTLNPNLEHWSAAVGKDAFIANLRKNYFRNTGSAMAAHTAHYQIMGLDILELRMERCYGNCMVLAGFMEKHPKVKIVSYPGLSSSPYYELSRTQFDGKPGTVMSFDLESEQACYRFMDALTIIRRATNLNDNKSLIIHPYSTIYAEFSREDRLKNGIRDTMIRLSVGIEAAADLIADVEQALKQL